MARILVQSAPAFREIPAVTSGVTARGPARLRRSRRDLLTPFGPAQWPAVFLSGQGNQPHMPLSVLNEMLLDVAQECCGRRQVGLTRHPPVVTRVSREQLELLVIGDDRRQVAPDLSDASLALGMVARGKMPTGCQLLVDMVNGGIKQKPQTPLSDAVGQWDLRPRTDQPR